MTQIPMDHLVALAEQRRARLLDEAERYRAGQRALGRAAPARGRAAPRPWSRLRARLTGRAGGRVSPAGRCA